MIYTWGMSASTELSDLSASKIAQNSCMPGPGLSNVTIPCVGGRVRGFQNPLPDFKARRFKLSPLSQIAPESLDILFLLDGMVGPGKARQARQGRGRTSHFTEPNRHERIAVDHTDSVPMNEASGCVSEVKK